MESRLPPHRCMRLDDLPRALSTLERMYASGVAPDVYAYNVMLQVGSFRWSGTLFGNGNMFFEAYSD